MRLDVGASSARGAAPSAASLGFPRTDGLADAQANTTYSCASGQPIEAGGLFFACYIQGKEGLPRA